MDGYQTGSKKGDARVATLPSQEGKTNTPTSKKSKGYQGSEYSELAEKTW